MPPFVMKTGDLGPPVNSTLTNASGPVDLTSATVNFRFRNLLGGPSRGGLATVLDPTAGTVRYNWQAGDTDVPGAYIGEFVASSPVITYPNKGYVNIVIVPSVPNPP